MVCESINPKIPYFNAQVFLSNKTSIGKVDEILGPINQVYVWKIVLLLSKVEILTS